MNVTYLHFWHLLYSNSEPAGGGGLRGRQRGVELEDDLVFEASVEIFMWEDDGVENYHLRRDVDVTTWGQKKKQKKTKGCLGGNVFYISVPLISSSLPRPFMNQ